MAAVAGDGADLAVHRAALHFKVDEGRLRAIWLAKVVAHEQHLRKKLRRQERKPAAADAT